MKNEKNQRNCIRKHRSIDFISWRCNRGSGRHNPSMQKPAGDVQISGIIGSFDNTTPGPNPGDLNEWINVTIPTTALFYTTQESGHQEIVSPTYTITNNSAKGVIATVADVIDSNNRANQTISSRLELTLR
ncbi:MAG: hypothetical protein ACLSIL_16340 [Enterococcus casseliflavus]